MSHEASNAKYCPADRPRYDKLCRAVTKYHSRLTTLAELSWTAQRLVRAECPLCPTGPELTIKPELSRSRATCASDPSSQVPFDSAPTTPVSVTAALGPAMRHVTQYLDPEDQRAVARVRPRSETLVMILVMLFSFLVASEAALMIGQTPGDIYCIENALLPPFNGAVYTAPPSWTSQYTWTINGGDTDDFLGPMCLCASNCEFGTVPNGIYCAECICPGDGFSQDSVYFTETTAVFELSGYDPIITTSVFMCQFGSPNGFILSARPTPFTFGMTRELNKINVSVDSIPPVSVNLGSETITVTSDDFILAPGSTVGVLGIPLAPAIAVSLDEWPDDPLSAEISSWPANPVCSPTYSPSISCAPDISQSCSPDITVQVVPNVTQSCADVNVTCSPDVNLLVEPNVTCSQQTVCPVTNGTVSCPSEIGISSMPDLVISSLPGVDIEIGNVVRVQAEPSTNSSILGVDIPVWVSLYELDSLSEPPASLLSDFFNQLPSELQLKAMNNFGFAEYEQRTRNKTSHSYTGNIRSGRAKSCDRHFSSPYSENTKQNPFVGLDSGFSIGFELHRIAGDLPEAARQVFRMVYDDDAVYTAISGCVYSENHDNDVEQRSSKPRVPSSATATSSAQPAPRTTPVDKTKQDQARLSKIADRLAARLSTWSDFVDLIYGRDYLAPRLAKLIYQRIVEGKVKLDGNAVDKYIVRSHIDELPRRRVFLGFSNHSRWLASLRTSPQFQSWLAGHFNASFQGAFIPRLQRGADPGDQLNGLNGEATNEDDMAWVFPNSMKEIEEMCSIRSLMEDGAGPTGKEFDPVREYAQLTGLLGPSGVTMSSVPRGMNLNGAIITAANAIELYNTLPKPSALLYPIEVRNDAGVLIDSTQRPFTWGVGTVLAKAKTLSEQSAAGRAVVELTVRSANIRPDQITDMGFRTAEMAQLLKLASPTSGDTLLLFFLKGWLYVLTLSHNQDLAFLPYGSEVSTFDSRTIIAPNANVQLGYNDGNVFASDCGGIADPVEPFQPNVRSQCAFFTSIAAVPAGQPWFVIRPGMLLQADLGPETANIIMLIMLIAGYPCGMHTVTVDTTDIGGDNAAPQQFLPFSSLISIAGPPFINIVLPCANAQPPVILGAGAGQAPANIAPLVQPQAGPTAAGAGPLALAANQFLNMSWQGQVQYYDVSTLLATWLAQPASPITVTGLTRFMKQLAQIYMRPKDYRFAFELASVLSVRFPPMVAQAPGADYVPNVNTLAGVSAQNFFALAPLQMSANFPLEINSFDWYLPDTNMIWFNSIGTGMYDATSDGGESPPPNYVWDAQPQLLSYSSLLAHDYAAVAEHIFTYMQMPTIVWNQAFTQQNFVSILAQIRNFFARALPSGTNEIMVSEYGDAIAGLHSRVLGTLPAVDMYGNFVWSYINAPRVGFQPPISADGPLYLINPCVLADIWVQTEICKPSKAMSPLLSTNKNLCGFVVPRSQVTPLGGGSYTVPIPIEHQARAVGIDTVPLIEDLALLNRRIAWHVFDSAMYTLDGVIYDVGMGPRWIVAQKWRPPDWTVINPMDSSILTANTRWFPFMTDIGLRIEVGVTAANGADQMTQIMARKTTTGLATWLVRHAEAQPNTIVDGGGSNSKSLIPTRSGKAARSSDADMGEQ